MIKVSYLVRDEDRYNGYTEERIKQFDNMEQVYNFINGVRFNRRVEGRSMIGAPLVLNSPV